MLHWFEILAINNEKINFDWNSIFDEIQIRLFSEFPAAKCLEIVNLSKAIKGTEKSREKNVLHNSSNERSWSFSFYNLSIFFLQYQFRDKFQLYILC